MAKRVVTLLVIGLLSTTIASGSDETFLQQFEPFLVVLGTSSASPR